MREKRIRLRVRANVCLVHAVEPLTGNASTPVLRSEFGTPKGWAVLEHIVRTGLMTTTNPANLLHDP